MGPRCPRKKFARSRVTLILFLLVGLLFLGTVLLNLEGTNDLEEENKMSVMPNSWIDEYFEKSSTIIKNINYLPKESDDNKEKNNYFCDNMVKWVWEEVIPLRFNEDFKKVLISQRRRHIAVANGKPEPNQKYIIWSLSGGLGNRIQALISIFIAALLSERVLLLKDWFTPLRSSNSPPIKPTLLPFIKNGNKTEYFRYENLKEIFWFSNGEDFPRTSNNLIFCNLFPIMSLTEFEKLYPEEFRKNQTSKDIEIFKKGHAKIDIRGGHDKNLKLWNHFLCRDSLNESKIDFFSQERFLYIWTNQYFLPIFYANKYTRKKMNIWFKKNPFRLLLPLVFLPARPVMYRVLYTMNSDFLFFKKRQYVGIHIRSFKKYDISLLIKSFSYCIENLIKNDNSYKEFFLATMYQSAKKYFTILKLKNNAKIFTINSDERKEEQSTGQGSIQEWNAITDVVLLSLSRHLLLSPTSTFGFLASAIGEIEKITFVNSKYFSSNFLDKICENKDGNIIAEPCFTSWFKHDFIGKQRNKIECEIENLPTWSIKCGTNI